MVSQEGKYTMAICTNSSFRGATASLSVYIFGFYVFPFIYSSMEMYVIVYWSNVDEAAPLGLIYTGRILVAEWVFGFSNDVREGQMSLIPRYYKSKPATI